MNWKSEQGDRDPDPLDRLLAEAQWPPPTPETIGRLRGQWRSLLGGRLQRRRRRRALALAAAGILLAVGLAFWMRNGRGAGGPLLTSVAPSSASPAVESVKPQGDLPPAKKALPAKPRGTSRSPRATDYQERRMLVAQRRLHAVRDHRFARAAPEAAMPQQALADMHVQAVRNMARVCDSSALVRLARQEQDPGTRQELLSMLLARGDLRSVRFFLECVAEPQTLAAALDCLALVPRPPMEVLFQCLHGPEPNERMAAALVLGRMNDLAVSRALIAMVLRGTHRLEALVALLSSSEATAQQFLAEAAANPALAASLCSAQRQFQHHLFSWRS